MYKQYFALAAAVGLLTTTGLGQSINVDFGSAAAPPDDYAGAGLAGVWNAVTVPFGQTSPLVGLDGRPIAATVTPGGHSIGPEEAVPDSPHAPLMNDAVGGVGDIVSSITFEMLNPGTYEIIVYGLNPAYPAELTSIYIGAFADFETIGGEWPGDLVEGVTHALFEWDVTDGTLVIGFAGGMWGHAGAINGVQLRNVSSETPTPGDLTGDGSVGVEDLLILLTAWGDCPDCTPGDSGGCPADLTGDCAVGVADLLILLGNWG